MASGRTRHLLAAAAAAIVVLVAATGCGSSNKTSASTSTPAPTTTAPTEAETWAHSACSSIAAWQNTVKHAAYSVKQSQSKDQARLAVQNALQATDQLVHTLKSLGPPGTNAGKQAKQIVSTLNDQLSSGAAKIKEATAANSELKGSAETVSAVSTTLVTMRDQMKTAGTKLRNLPSGELEQAITSSDACKTLAATSGA
jgi:hypothetical protein